MMTKRLLPMMFLFALAGTACGDVNNVHVSLSFPDQTVQQSARSLLFVVREAPKSGDGCDQLWSSTPTGLAENRSVIPYPNRNDIVAAPVNLAMYPKLTLLVYAHPTDDPTMSQPLAGGCQAFDTDVKDDIAITMVKPPVAGS